MKKIPYHRYHIETKKTPNILPHPNRFKVNVNKIGLAKHLISELFQYRFDLNVVMSRPCVYGVFSGPLGGFAPREHLCVGCLRCTTEHPDFVAIHHNPERKTLGDSFFTPDQVDTVILEAETGHIPIKGAGYRGKFGGTGWDGLWTDMSEIVRPTRDGIHGREYISTEVDLGGKYDHLRFDDKGELLLPELPHAKIELPLLFDPLPNSAPLAAWEGVAEAARHLHTFFVVPIKTLITLNLKGPHLIPLIDNAEELDSLSFTPHAIELNHWDGALFNALKARYPAALLILRTPYEEEKLLNYYKAGARIFHLTADAHGRGKSGAFVIELIRKVHETFLEADIRDQVTLIGSGGIIAAEHVPKAIICGLDAVVLDTVLTVALQAKFGLEELELSSALTIEWTAQRIKNLAGSWRDQLLEVLGAMGLREVRRLRGETGRVMFQKDLEKEAFTGISGYAAE